MKDKNFEGIGLYREIRDELSDREDFGELSVKTFATVCKRIKQLICLDKITDKAVITEKLIAEFIK